MSVQVAWATFAGVDGDLVLCMLQHATLTTYSLKGELYTVPLPPHVSSMHPLPQGLLLSVRLRVHDTLFIQQHHTCCLCLLDPCSLADAAATAAMHERSCNANVPCIQDFSCRASFC